MSHAAFCRFLESRKREHFTEFVLGTRSQVFNTARRVCGNRDLARDVTHDAYARLLTTRVRADDVKNPEAFVVAHVVTLARTRLRSETRRLERETFGAQVRADRRSSLTQDEALDLDSALGELPQELLQVVELRYSGLLMAQRYSALHSVGLI